MAQTEKPALYTWLASLSFLLLITIGWRYKRSGEPAKPVLQAAGGNVKMYCIPMQYIFRLTRKLARFAFVRARFVTVGEEKAV